MDIRERALAMERVLSEPVFQDAVAEIRAEALELLITTQATDADAIREAQALVKALDALTGKFRWTVQAAKIQRKSQHPA